MNSTSREVRRLNTKSFFNRRGLWCCRCCLSCFWLFGQPASACTSGHLFVRLPGQCLEVCLSFVICHLSKHLSAVHSIVIIVLAGYIRLLFKLPLNFRDVLQHTESRSSYACNQNTLLCFKTKRTKHKLILHENIHATRE